MERCGISENTIIGRVCRLIPGTQEKSCYLRQEAQGEPKETRNLLESLVQQHPGCLFQQETLKYIKSNQ